LALRSKGGSRLLWDFLSLGYSKSKVLKKVLNGIGATLHVGLVREYLGQECRSSRGSIGSEIRVPCGLASDAVTKAAAELGDGLELN